MVSHYWLLQVEGYLLRPFATACFLNFNMQKNQKWFFIFSCLRVYSVICLLLRSTRSFWDQNGCFMAMAARHYISRQPSPVSDKFSFKQGYFYWENVINFSIGQFFLQVFQHKLWFQLGNLGQISRHLQIHRQFLSGEIH